MEPKDRTWPEPEGRNLFRSEGSAVQEDLALKPPLPHLTINGQVPKPSNRNQPCQHFHKPTRPPLTHKSLMEPQVRETDLSSASCLFAGQPCNKILCYLKNYCQHIGFYVLQAANPLLGNITPKITLWRNKINDITKKLCLGRGKSRK